MNRTRVATVADAAAIAAIHVASRAARGWRATERTRDGVAGIPFVTWRLVG